MFHLIYTRSNTEYYKGDTFESNYTLYRNIPYSELSKFLEFPGKHEVTIFLTIDTIFLSVILKY